MYIRSKADRRLAIRMAETRNAYRIWGGGRLGNDTSEYRRGDEINTLG